MAKTEVISLSIAFFYTIFVIALSGLMNFLLMPSGQVESLGLSLDPAAAILQGITSSLSAVFPIGIGFVIMMAAIIIALVTALFTNDKIALGMIGAAKVLIIYLGITIVFFLITEQMIVRSTNLISTESSIPYLTLVTIIISAIALMLMVGLAFFASNPKRRAIFDNE